MPLGSAINSIIVLLRNLNTDKPTVHTVKNKHPDKTVVFDGDVAYLERAKPEDVGLSSAYVDSFLKEVVKDTAIRANRILILKEGKVIAERYEHPYTRDSWDCVFSATKTVTALALGALWDEGKVDLDVPVCKILGMENKVGNLQNKKITLRHLLTMSTGNMFNEIESATSLRWVKAFFDSGNKFKVGSKFEYNSLNTYMIGACIQKIAGMPLAEYVDQKIFGPMGLAKTYFEQSPEGIAKSGWGLYILPEDMAKLGQMVLEKGLWRGQRILSEEWIDMMSHKQIEATKAGHRFDYGFQMWVDEDKDFCCFNGMFNQEVHIWRRSGVVVVMCCANNEAFHGSNIYTIGAKYFAEAEAGDFALVTEDASRDLVDLPNLRYLLEAIAGRHYVPKDKIANSCGLLPLLMQNEMGTYAKGIKGLRFEQEGEDWVLWVTEHGKDSPLRFNFGEGVRAAYDFYGNLYDCVADARFILNERSEPMLVIRLFLLEYACSRYFTLRFGKTYDKLTVELSENPSTGFIESLLEAQDESTRRLIANASKLIDKNLIATKTRNLFFPSFPIAYKPAPDQVDAAPAKTPAKPTQAKKPAQQKKPAQTKKPAADKSPADTCLCLSQRSKHTKQMVSKSPSREGLLRA